MADASIIMSTPTESERKRTRENGDLNFSEMQQPENDFPAPGAVAEDSEERVAKRARFELGSPQNPVLLDDENGCEKRVLESENENGYEKRVLESENENGCEKRVLEIENENGYEKRVLESENENGNEKRVLESENCVQNEENKVVPDFDVTIIESDDNEVESKEENVAVEVALPKVVSRRAKKSVVDAVVEESQQRRVSPRLQTAERPLYFPRPRIVRAKAKQNENDDDDDDDRNDDDEKQGSRQKSERGPRNGVTQYDGAEPLANGAQEILSGGFDPRAVGLKGQDILSPLAAATSLKPNGKGVTNGEGTIQSSNASSEESSETSDQCVIGLSADDMLTPGAAAISVKTNGVSKHTRHKKANNVNNSASASPTSNLARARKGAKPVTKCKAALVAGQSVEVGESEEALAHPSDLNDAFWTQSLGVSDSHETLGISPDARVRDTLRKYNAYYLQFVKEEEDRCKREKPNGGKGSKKEIKEKDQKGSKNSKSGKGGNGSNGMKEEKNSARRPDLKAISKMLTTNGILFPTKRPGHIPGVNVGDHFFSRCEMIAIGFHSHWLNGIDYMGKSFEKMEEYKGYRFPLAVAIVLSGQYEDDVDNAENVVYTGQGGHDLLGKKHQIKDQEMSRGNLALKNCIYQKTPVRVIRGHDSKNSYTGKVYTYDGLYQVVKYWAEKGLSGFTVFKYRLRRLAGQPVLTTNQVRFSRGQIPQSTSELRGLVCKDISNGQERIPVVASNVVDDPPVQPTGFTYIKSIKVAKGIDLPPPANGCECRGECFDPRKCACARLNGMEFPYVHRDGGRLVEAKDVVYECGPNCGCGPNCINKASQHGLKYRLEVFRTPNKGWAVRSWDSIPSGALVCEYTGILMRTDELDKTSTDNSFIFEIDCLQTMEGIDGRQRRLGELSKHKDIQMDKLDDKKDGQPEFGIDAGTSGGVARFINHSCDPNLFVQCVLSSHHDVRLARVLLVASDNIPPLQELTYDYGYVLDSVADGEGRIKQMPCYCGAIDCRKRLY